MRAYLRPAVVLFIALTLVTGVVYPLAVTGVAQLVFPSRANGSLLVDNGKIAGSRLIGQPFTSPKYFWSRPSATSPQPYNGAASGGSNQGPLNPALVQAVNDRAKALRDADPGNRAVIPVDLVTASASGLDPDISLAAAYYQEGRVARERKLSQGQVHKLVDATVSRPWLGWFGEATVNVLELNRALDKLGG